MNLLQRLLRRQMEETEKLNWKALREKQTETEGGLLCFKSWLPVKHCSLMSNSEYLTEERVYRELDLSTGHSALWVMGL